MSGPYHVFVEDDAIELLLSIRANERHEIRRFIRSLADDPFQEGDFPEKDREGRTVFAKLVGSYSIGFYPDHAVKEVKVFEISRADG